MTNRTLILAAGVVAIGAAAAYWINAQSQTSGDVASADVPSDWNVLDDLQTAAESAYMKTAGAVGLVVWRAPEQYAPMIMAAEKGYGIPYGVLERLLYQECHYREDIITGAKKSRVGALGIAQFMPATAEALGIDPLDPAQAIDAAGKYLSQLYKQFGNWQEALGAYNWGPGNVRKKGLANAPAETRAYYHDILADVGAVTGMAFA